MKKALFTFILVILAIISNGQKFYVDGKDNKSVEKIKDKISFEGFNITSDSTSADFIVQLLVDGQYKVVSMKRPYKGYIRIVNHKSNEEVGRTKLVKGSPTAFNGYNASYIIFSKISDKYLKELLIKCKQG